MLNNVKHPNLIEYRDVFIQINEKDDEFYGTLANSHSNDDFAVL